MTAVPFGDYRPDIADLDTQFTKSLTNVLPRADGYGPFPDFSSYTGALPAACRGFFIGRKTDGSVAVFAGTSTKLYILDATALTWTDASLGSGVYAALSSTDQWQFAQFGNFVLATQANAVLQEFDLTSSTNFANTAGSPPQAKYISIVNRFVLLTGLTSNPYRIQWSGLNDRTNWTSGINSSDFQDFPDGGVVRGSAGGEYGIVFQDAAIRRMTYTPGNPVIFIIERIAEDHGLYAPYSLIKTSDKIFYLSPHGFETLTPTSPPVPIGKERVDRTFLADLDKGNLQLLLGAADPRSSRVYWAYKSNSGTAGLFDKIICYDWALQRFSPITVSGEYLASISQPGLTLESLDNISGSLDALPFSLDDVATSVTPEIAAVNSAHKLGFFRGLNLEATLDTAEQNGAGQRFFVQGYRVLADAPTVYGSISYRENQSGTASQLAESTMNARGFVPLRRSTRYARGRIRIPAATIWTYANGLEPEFTSAGRR